MTFEKTISFVNKKRKCSVNSYQNIFANYASRLWSIGSVYLFVPIYIRILGVESYGLISYYSLLLSIILIADAGLSATFTRETASQTEDQQIQNLLTSIEKVLFIILFLVGMIVFICAPMIAENWKDSTEILSVELITKSLQLMPLALIPQVAISLYFGGLMGMEHQVKANVLMILFSLVRSGIVIVPIYFYPEPHIFFIWQIITSWVFMIIMRSTLKQKIVRNTSVAKVLSWNELKPVLSYALGIFLVSVIAVINTSLDKLVVSFMRSLEEFAYYSIAGTLAQIPLILTTPIAATVLPRFIKLIKQNKRIKLRFLYEKNSYMIASIGSTSTFILYFFNKEIINIWMPRQTIPTYVFPVIKMLAIGSLFLTLQLMPFYLSLANGNTKTNIKLGLFMLIFMAPLTYFLTYFFGLIGAAIPWMILNFTAFLYLGYVLNKKYNNGIIFHWFININLIPVILSLSLFLIAYYINNIMKFEPIETMFVAGIFGLITISISYWIMGLIKSYDHKY